LQVDNDLARKGLALLDEFSDAVSACIKDGFDGDVKVLSICELSAFHEKAGKSQERFSLSVFSFLPVDSLHSSRAASVAILPSALLVERFSLGAWWAFPIQ
jgi:hypothetical protein